MVQVRAGVLPLVLQAEEQRLLLVRSVDARTTLEESFAPSGRRDWVSALGPYNEHLVLDYGELNLAFEVLLVFAAALLERRLVRASLRDSADRRRISPQAFCGLAEHC
jgi:hypothetical protein